MLGRNSRLLILLVGSGLGLFSATDIAERIRVAQASGKFDQAAELYRELIASGVDGAEVRSNLAAMLHLAGRDQDALAQARLALQTKPTLVGAELIAGASLERMGQAKTAIAYFESAHKHEPRAAAPLLALGQAYVGLRDYARSNAAYREASRIDPGNAEAWYGVGITYRSLADSVLKAAPLGKTPPRAKELLASALDALTRAASLDPQSPRIHLIMAESFRESGKLTEAVAEYQDYLRLKPDDPAAELGLATAYWTSNEGGNAKPHVESVLRRWPADPEANGILAQILVSEGHFEEAAPYARRALDGNGQLTQVRFALAKIYLSRKNPEAAIEELQKIAPADPDGRYLFVLHRALRMVGRDSEAAAALAEFKRLRAKSGAPPENP